MPMSTPITFTSDGVTLRGTLFTPSEPAATQVPLVILSSGLGTLHQWSQPTVDVFVEAGLACLTFDYRGFGFSDGSPRQEADPWMLVHDLRTAIDFAQTLPEVDPERIGLWGTCYGGGPSIVVAAVDPRVKVLVTQVPLISGGAALRSFSPPEVIAALTAGLEADRRTIVSGGPRTRLIQVALDPAQPAVAYDKRSYEWMQREAEKTPHWINELTLQTVGKTIEFEPGDYLPRIGTTPLLMIVADDDVITPTELTLQAYNRVEGPKQLIRLAGDHFCVYDSELDLVSNAARDWFVGHLVQTSAE